jgi:hypothetical protein
VYRRPPDQLASRSSSTRAAGIGSRAGHVGPQFPLDLGVGRPPLELVRVEACLGRRARDRLGLVQQAAAEVQDPQPSEDVTDALGGVDPRGDDGPTGRDRGRHPRPLAGVDRHPVLAGDPPKGARLTLGREALLDVLLGRL